MNLVEIAGHLGADPETRVTPSGMKITNLRIATNSRRQGKDETIWWKVTIFGDRFDKMLVHLKKGSAIIVIGELNKPEIWMDKEGRPQISLEIIAEMIRFNPFGKTDRPAQESGGQAYGSQQQPQQGSYAQTGYSSQSAPSYSEAPRYEQQPYASGRDSHYPPASSYPSSSQSPGGSGDEELPF